MSHQILIDVIDFIDIVTSGLQRPVKNQTLQFVKLVSLQAVPFSAQGTTPLLKRNPRLKKNLLFM